jgi:hypothetical protein
MESFKPVDPRQPDIQNHQFEDGPRKDIEARFAFIHRLDVKAFVFENTAQGLPDAGFVVNDQNARRSHDVAQASVAQTSICDEKCRRKRLVHSQDMSCLQALWE